MTIMKILAPSAFVFCSVSLSAHAAIHPPSDAPITVKASIQSGETIGSAPPENRFKMTVNEEERCFTSNGLPDHATGQFPNRGNPNAIEPQDVQVCVPLIPKRARAITPIRGTMGIAMNGVQFRPNTAGFYDPDARRGHSRNGDRNWSLDIHGAPGKLGLDFNNAHVGRGGLYHYHGIAKHLLVTTGSSLIGYAGDGYEIHYVGSKVQSGWQLKSGERPNNEQGSGPSGRYDGTYNEDYVYVGGADADGSDFDGRARLDQCNGGPFDGHYVYFVTDSYPFVPRCLTGVVSDDFNKANHNAERGRNGPRGRNGRGRPNREGRGEGRGRRRGAL